MTKLDNAIDRARKLLALSHSDNPHEAAQAAQRAQELLDRFAISRAMLDNAESGDGDEVSSSADSDTPLHQARCIAVWISILAKAVAEVNQCRAYTSRVGRGPKSRRHIEVVGRPADVEKVRYLHGYLVGETQRLCQRDGRGRGRTWRNNYRLGVVDTLCRGLQAARAEVVAKMKAEADNQEGLVAIDRALVRLDRRAAEVDLFVARTLNLRSTSSTYRGDSGAWARGREAGSEISIGGARGALN